MTPIFENAQEMARKHPATFEAPTLEEIAAVQPGDSIKVCTCNERFWVEVLTIDAETQKITGRVDNELLFVEDHGLDYGDEIEFSFDNVYTI